MKIDEPKTPYARRYDPAEDEEEIHGINAQEVMVDELDQAEMEGLEESKSEGQGQGQGQSLRRGPGLGRTSDIPGLELGEPAEELPPVTEGAMEQGTEMKRSNSARSEKTVVVDRPNGTGGAGAEGKDYAGMSGEELEKHRRFEERRKKHYEMKDVKGLLG